MALAAINVDSAVHAANIADANGWKVGGVVYSTDPKYDVLKKICAAGSGEPIRVGGMLYFLVDAPRVSLDTITTDDLIGKCTVPSGTRMKDRINGVIPSFRSPDNDWQIVPATKVTVADYVTVDGRPRTKPMTWELVQSASQVATLATYAICNAREIDGIVLPCKVRWIGYKPGDAVTVSSSVVAMDSQLIVLRKRNLDPAPGAVTFTARTETTAKHAFALAQTTTPPPTPALATVDRTGLLNPGVNASWSAVADDDGHKPEDDATVGATIGVDLKLPTGLLADILDVINPALVLAPDGRLIQTVPAIGTIPAVTSVRGTLTLPDLGAASDTARRQLESDLAGLSAAIIQLTVGQSMVQNIFRDAGLSIDPATGFARLFAIEQTRDQLTSLSVTLNAALGTIGLKASVNYVDEAILAASLGGSTADLSPLLVRLTSAEADIDGLSATVLLKADATVVTGLQGMVGAVQQSIDAINVTLSQKASQTALTAQEVRLTAAEQTIQALDGASISQAVTATRLIPANTDVTGEGNILALLNGETAKNATQTGIAQARTDLNARVDGAFAVSAVLSAQLAVEIGTVTAQLATETATRITGDQASATSLASYKTVNDQAVGTLTTYVGTLTTNLSTLSASVTSLTSSYTGLSGTVDSLGNTVAGHTASLATVNSTLATQSTTNSSTANAITGLQSSVGGINDSLSTINSTLATQSTTNSSAANAITGLQSSVGGINDSLSTINSTLATQSTTNSSAANAITGLQSSVGGINTNLATVNSALTTQATTNSTVAGQIGTIGTTLAGHSSTLTTYGESINGLLLKYGVEFNSDGRITGFALNGGGARTDAVFVVTNFKIAQPGGAGARTVFEVDDDGTVRMPSVEVDTIRADTVEARHLVGSAVQQVAYSVLQSAITIAGS